mgnify:CR=1 FL=1
MVVACLQTGSCRQRVHTGSAILQGDRDIQEFHRLPRRSISACRECRALRLKGRLVRAGQCITGRRTEQAAQGGQQRSEKREAVEFPFHDVILIVLGRRVDRTVLILLYKCMVKITFSLFRGPIL